MPAWIRTFFPLQQLLCQTCRSPHSTHPPLCLCAASVPAALTTTANRTTDWPVALQEQRRGNSTSETGAHCHHKSPFPACRLAPRDLLSMGCFKNNMLCFIVSCLTSAAQYWARAPLGCATSVRAGRQGAAGVHFTHEVYLRHVHCTSSHCTGTYSRWHVCAWP